MIFRVRVTLSPGKYNNNVKQLNQLLSARSSWQEGGTWAERNQRGGHRGLKRGHRMKETKRGASNEKPTIYSTCRMPYCTRTTVLRRKALATKFSSVHTMACGVDYLKVLAQDTENALAALLLSRRFALQSNLHDTDTLLKVYV